MEAVNVHIGPLVFDPADYDAEGAVLGQGLEILQLSDGGQDHACNIGRAYRVSKNNRLDPRGRPGRDCGVEADGFQAASMSGG